MRPRLEPGEQIIRCIRSHWWYIARSAIWFFMLFIILPCSLLFDYFLPSMISESSANFAAMCYLALCGIFFLKWFMIDFRIWYTTISFITDRRIIQQHGLFTVERREIPLHAVTECTFNKPGRGVGVFDYGDVYIETKGRGSNFLLRRIRRPQQVHALITTYARTARQVRKQQQAKQPGINAALTRIFNSTLSPHNTPTQALPRVTPLTARIQRYVNLAGDESTVKVTRRSWLSFFCAAWSPAAILGITTGAATVFDGHKFILLLGIIYIILVIWILWSFLNWYDTLYLLTSERILELRRSPFLLELHTTIPLQHIQDIIIHIQTPIGRLLKVGKITLQLNDKKSFILLMVPQPELWQQRIRAAIDAALQDNQLREQEKLASTLSEWFKEYHRMQTTP